MPQTPRLTIVTPSLNQKDFLRQNIANVAQLGTYVEHIVSDGASTDGTLDLLEQHQKRVRFRSAKDKNMYQAVNAGFDMAQGDIFGYLNCDDLLFPWTAQIVIQAFDDHPEIDWLYGDALEMRQDRWTFLVQPPTAILKRYISIGGFLAQPAVFFRKRLWQKLRGFDDSLRLLGDHDFWLRAIVKNSPVLKVQECLAVCRMPEGQLMQTHTAQAMREQATILQHQGIVQPTHRLRIVRRALFAGMHRSAISTFAAAQLLRRARSLHSSLPWARFLNSEFFSLVSPQATARALVGSTSQHAYLKISKKGQNALLPNGEQLKDHPQ